MPADNALQLHTSKNTNNVHGIALHCFLSGFLFTVSLFSLHCHTNDPAVLFQINKIREFYLIACFLFFSFNPQEVIRSLVKRYVASMIRSAKTSEGLTEENFKVLLKLTALYLSHINIRKCMLINKNTDTSNHSSNLEIFFHI